MAVLRLGLGDASGGASGGAGARPAIRKTTSPRTASAIALPAPSRTGTGTPRSDAMLSNRVRPR